MRRRTALQSRPTENAALELQRTSSRAKCWKGQAGLAQEKGRAWSRYGGEVANSPGQRPKVLSVRHLRHGASSPRSVAVGELAPRAFSWAKPLTPVPGRRCAFVGRLSRAVRACRGRLWRAVLRNNLR